MAEPKFRVGQKVICARMFDGSDLYWDPLMTSEIGKTGTIMDISPYSIAVDTGGLREWRWPESSLDPAEPVADLKVGDWVLVERVDREWDNWCSTLDNYVGKILKVRETYRSENVSLWVDSDHSDYWTFPRDWLKPVPAPAKDRPMEIVITGLRTSNPIGAIKALRQATGGGLRENKDAVNQLRQPMRWPMRFKLEAGLDLTKTLTNLRNEGFEVQAEGQVAVAGPPSAPSLPAMLDAIRQEFNRLSAASKQQEDAVRVAVEAERKRWADQCAAKDAELSACLAEITKLANELAKYRRAEVTGDSRMAVLEVD